MNKPLQHKLHTQIRPLRERRKIDLRELWAYRDLLYFLTWRDVKIRYKQTMIGVAWALIQPAIKLTIFTVIFGRLAKIDSEGYPYAVFAYTGLLPWQFFSESLSRSSQSVLSNSNLISKVYFPRLIIPVASIGANLIDFAISSLLLVGLMIYYQLWPGWGLLYCIPLTVMTIGVATGFGILISALNVSYRDFKYIIPFALQIWLYLTPVIYPVTIFPERWEWVLYLNPMSGIVEGFRGALLDKPFSMPGVVISGLVTVSMLLISLWVFRRKEATFADII